MKYPYKYPKLYGELAMQGKTKKELALTLGITLSDLRYKQSVKTDGDFKGDEMKAAAALLDRPLEYLFGSEGALIPASAKTPLSLSTEDVHFA